MTTLTQAVTSFEAQLSEVVETFTSANDLAETKASQANASAITAFDKAAEALTSKNAASASAANALTSENAASGQADLATNAAATTQTLRDSIIATQGAIGYLPPVAYTAGLAITLPAQTVSYSGQAYAPLLSALPFTTSGTFETAKFRLIQGVAAVDLAAASGAGMVGFEWAALPAAINKIDWALRTAATGINVLRHIPPNEWAAIFANTSTYNATASIQAAINAGSIWIPDGTFNVSSVAVNAHGRNVSGQSKNAIIKRIALTYLPLFVSDGMNDFCATGFSIDGNKAGNPLGLSGGLTPTAGGSPIAITNQGDIVCRNGAGAKIERVDFINSFTSPILFYAMNSAEMERCRSVGHAREGFYIVGGRDCKINGCVSRGAASLPWSLIATGGLDTDTWDHNHVVSNNDCFDSQAAFVTINTKGTHVFGNKIGKTLGLASTGPGLRLGHPSIPGKTAARSKAYDNDIFGIADIGSGGTGRGISIEGADGCEVFDNRASACRTGIGASVALNADFVVRDNSAFACTNIGIELYYVMRAKVINNLSRDCPTGLLISGQDCKVTDNYVQNASTTGYNINAASGLNSGHVFDGNRTDSTTVNKWSIASPALHTYLNNEYGTDARKVITLSGAIPSGIEGNLFNVNNASATTVTSLANWKEGAEYTLFFANSNSTLTQSGGSFRLKGGVSVTPSVGQVIKVLALGSLFYEVSRSF